MQDAEFPFLGVAQVEKYRPKSLDDVIAHKDIIDTSAEDALRQLPLAQTLSPLADASPRSALLLAVSRLTKEDRLPHLLLYGPPGTGKTSTILAVARQIYGNGYKNMTLELNASDERGIDIVRERIQDFASTKRIFRCAFSPRRPAALGRGRSAQPAEQRLQLPAARGLSSSSSTSATP